MIDKKKLHESLGNFIDAVTNGEDTDQDIFRGFVDSKVEQVLGEKKSITLDGDDVMIDGKKVGTAKTDGDDDDTKVDYKSDCGKHEKSFESVKAMYEYLGANYTMKEGKIEDALGTQDAMKGERLKRWSAVRNKKQPDGKAGDYDAKDVRKDHNKASAKS